MRNLAGTGTSALFCTNAETAAQIVLYCNSYMKSAEVGLTIAGYHNKGNVQLRFDDEQAHELQPVSTFYAAENNTTHYTFYDRYEVDNEWNWLHDRMLVAMLQRHTISWQVDKSSPQIGRVTTTSIPAIRTYLQTVTNSSCPLVNRFLRPHKP